MEEGKGDRSDIEGTKGVPDLESIVELLSHGEGSEIPRLQAINDVSKDEKKVKQVKTTHVSTLVRIFGVTSSRNSARSSNTTVDSVNGSEGVSVLQEVSQSLIGAGLESASIASCSGVESVDGSQNSVRINTRASSTSVSGNVRASRVPEGLEEAEDVGSLSWVTGDCR